MLPVFGHRNPDTDAIVSAIVFASYLTRTGTPARPYRLGELNFETPFVLRTVGLQVPPMLPELPAGAQVALVDHNETMQSAANLADLRVSHVLDHHKLGDLATSEPLWMRFEPVGACGTILLGLYREAGLEIDRREATLMLASVLSDTLHFRSPTTTNADRQAVEVLAPIAGIDDVEAFALQMFAAKSDLGDTPAIEIAKMDYKEFAFGQDDKQQRWGLGVVETTNAAYVLGRKDELLAALGDIKTVDGLDGVLLSVVDILAENNVTLVPDASEAAMVEAVFGVHVNNQEAQLGATISRKKQIVPAFEAYFEQQG